jgi:S1-C subfamily serine protease
MGRPACFYLPVTVLDWAIAGLIASIAIRGIRRGPLAGLLSFGAYAAVTLALVWILAAAVLRSPATGELQGEVRRSLIVRELNRLLPPPGPVLEAIDRVDPLPRIGGPTGPVAPPDAAIAADPDVRGVSRSVVRVLGTACGLGVEGSGWVAAPGLVVTNAHVVAGEDDTAVTTVDGATLDAVPVLYDPGNDLALLRVDASLPPLRIAADPRPGSGGAVLGYPENGPYALSPARLGETSTAISEDAYGNGPIHRSIAFLRGSVRSGNSGGPLVDSHGHAMATVFAATTSGPPGGFAIPNEIVRQALPRAAATEVDTGTCTG